MIYGREKRKREMKEKRRRKAKYIDFSGNYIDGNTYTLPSGMKKYVVFHFNYYKTVCQIER